MPDPVIVGELKLPEIPKFKPGIDNEQMFKMMEEYLSALTQRTKQWAGNVNQTLINIQEEL